MRVRPHFWRRGSPQNAALVFPVCPCFDFRDCLRLPPEILDLRLGVFDLGRVQVVEGIEKTAKVVM